MLVTVCEYEHPGGLGGVTHTRFSPRGPINPGLATPFLSYRVTLNASKTRDFIRDLIIWQSYKLGPLRQWSD